MNIAEFLSPDCTRSAVRRHSKKRLIEIVSELAAPQLPALSAKEIFDSLLAREKLGSTGIGNGIAIPHGRMATSDKVVAVFLQCAEPVAFDAIDNRPIDLLFALLVPADRCDQHLRTLALVAEKLNDRAVVKQLRAASSDAELYQLITG